MEREIFENHPHSYPLLPEKVGRLFWDSAWDCAVACKNAGQSERIVGYRMFSFPNEHWGGEAFGESLGVLPELRRRGVAASLLAETHRMAARKGAVRFFSLTHPGNIPSLSAMLKVGYDLRESIDTRHGPRFVMAFECLWPPAVFEVPPVN